MNRKPQKHATQRTEDNTRDDQTTSEALSLRRFKSTKTVSEERSRMHEPTLPAQPLDPAQEATNSHAFNMIIRILASGKLGDHSLTQTVSVDDVYNLLDAAKCVFQTQPVCLELDGPIHVCGDIHGQFADLLRLFDRVGFPHRVNYLFLGDYVDRGKHCLEVILLLFAYRVLFPGHFYLLRGNHECPLINKQYGFYDECQRRYKAPRVWEAFQDVFSWMPLTAVIGERVLCMHGGLSPKLTSVEQLRQFKRPNFQPESPSIEIDVLWSDPSNFHKGWAPNSRGVSYVFGPDALRRLLADLQIDLVVRAHQVVQDGYEFFAGRRLVTLFSAPFYCGQFDNAAAVLLISVNLKCSFTILRPKKRSAKRRLQPPKRDDFTSTTTTSATTTTTSLVQPSAVLGPTEN